MRFRNREEAARLLAERLVPYGGQHPLVLAVPRGAVPMARIIAEALDGDLDVVLVRKLRAPGQPELAIGAVDELQFFEDFSEVSDADVVIALERGSRIHAGVHGDSRR